MANTDCSDHDLIEAGKEGNKRALGELIKKYKDWIYNTALSFTGNPQDAADLTQEVLIKIVTHLNSFRMKSSFKTWVFRIAKNHFLNSKRNQYEQNTTSFQDFANGLDEIPDEDLSNFKHDVEKELLIKEAKISCMRGMLLCLDREQRLIFILGEIFEFSSAVGGEIMGITKGNFRVRLHRARNDLYTFMDGKCGLINKDNPCRCARKTKGFIEKGYVDPNNLQFKEEVIHSVQNTAERKVNTLSTRLNKSYQKLFRDIPFSQVPAPVNKVEEFATSDGFLETFNLD